MKNRFIAISGAIVFASIASPVLMWWQTRAILGEQEERLHREEMEISEIRQNRRVADDQPSGQTGLSETQLRELLRLRAEAAALRRQTNEDARSASMRTKSGSGEGPASSSTSEWSDDERAAELANDTIEAMKGMLQVLPGILERYSQEHNGKGPGEFSDLRKYFSKLDGTRVPGLYTFQFVREGGPKSGDRLMLKEQSWRGRSGTASKVYGFSNGEVQEISFADDDLAQRSFANWESMHLSP